MIQVGEETTVGADSSQERYSTFFEDDGETGYFYAWDSEKEGNHICDALHIYSVRSVVDKDRTSELQIGWSEDGLKSALLLNGDVHAVFNFSVKRGFCRNDASPANKDWTQYGHEWNDEAIRAFQ